MKRLNFLFTMFFAAVLTFGLTACEEDEDELYEDEVPMMVLETFEMMYPNAMAKYYYENGTYKAVYKHNGYDREVWIFPDGTWLMTKTQTPRRNAPQAIFNYINQYYYGWSIDDIDYIETPYEKYYLVEIEMPGEVKQVLKFSQTGHILQ